MTANVGGPGMPGEAPDYPQVRGVIPFLSGKGFRIGFTHIALLDDHLVSLPASLNYRGTVFLQPPPSSSLVDRFPSVKDELTRVAIPQPLLEFANATKIPYRDIRRVRLMARPGPLVSPLLQVWHAHGSPWWLFRRSNFQGDWEKARYAKELLPSLLPVPVEIEGV